MPLDKVGEERNSKQTDVDQADEQTSGIKRRQFIQGALVGATAAAYPSAAQPQSGQRGSAQGGNRRSVGEQSVAPAPPPNVTPIDFSSLQETWIEPWVWRPSDWTGQQLSLNVVENQNPGPPIGLGNIGASLFSYGGTAPGPTIRMRGDETLLLKLRNFLDKDWGTTFVNEYPDPGPLPAELGQKAVERATERGQLREDFCIGEHTNGVHSNHVTNLHTHGLHVRPGKNIDGTLSDNIIQRIMSKRDWEARQDSPNLDCRFLLDREQVGEGDYEFVLGDVMGDPDAPHPPGTHWYHPHSHGATHNQVSSGMAGFLLVEGDVDEAINRRLTGEQQANPEIKTGDWDYRERLMMVQRVSVNPSKDQDAPDGESDLKNPQTPFAPTINGSNQPKLITMRPGAIERWRILNGSVDGRGYKRFMVLEGQYVTEFISGNNNPMRNGVLRRVTGENQLAAVSPQEVAANKQRLYQLAMDGVTLVSPEGDYKIKDLAQQNPEANQYSPTEETTASAALEAFQACFSEADEGKNVRDCFVRPNEVYLAPANRSDVFFQAPRDGATKVFTVLAKAVVVHGDNYQQSLQRAVASSAGADGPPPPPPGDIIIAYIAVSGDPAPRFDVMSLIGDLPPAPAYLQPIDEDELQVTAAESASRPDLSAGDYRSRVMAYSGWGAADFPYVNVPQDYVEQHPELEFLRYNADDDNGYYLLAPNTRTMAINADLDLSYGDPAPPKKFNPDEPDRARMLVDTAEEWVVYNNSITLWGDSTQQLPGVATGAKTGYAIERGVGQARNAREHGFQILTKGVDHPFHIHINPFYLLRVEVPDDEGNLINILDEPRWQDVIWLPRNGGRVVFRSRFSDFIGEYVHHCHILLHEDNGMMHVVETTQYADRANYRAMPAAASFADSAEEVSALYGRPSLEQSFKQSISFVDDNTTGQIYPGFDVEPPEYSG